MRKFGLIGQPLGHSFSPEIHAHLGNYEYKLYPLLPEQLNGFMQNNSLSGFNVTIPYKSDIIAFCNELSEKATQIGSVNTVIKREDGSYFGDNTDYYGFLDLLGQDAKKIAGKKALILGSGGTAKAVRAALLDVGADPIITISRSGEDNYTNISRHYDAYLIVNTTPVGMYPNNGEAVIELKQFNSCELVLDMIYNPAKTKLLFDAEKLGIACRNGLYMLVSQAKRASEIFTKESIADEKVMQITDTLSRKTKNIILIGMPGSGKTTIGKKLAQLTNRPFYDTDEIIVKRERMDISHIFSEKGELYFRNLETEILRDVCKISSAVIAAGGGVVTTAENYELLHQNSTVVLIERDIDSLCTENRPISQNKGVKELYLERKPLYEAFSHFRFYSSCCFEKTAQEIKTKLKL